MVAFPALQTPKVGRIHEKQGVSRGRSRVIFVKNRENVKTEKA